MNLNNDLLKQAITFIYPALSEFFSYSKYLYVNIRNKHVELKLSSGIINAIGIQYEDDDLQAEDQIEFVCEITPLKLFIQQQKEPIQLSENGQELIFIGKRGRLRLRKLYKAEYEICGFHDDKFNYKEINDTAFQIKLNTTDTPSIENFCKTLSSMNTWSDNTTPSPLFRGMCIKKGRLSVRQSKFHLSLLSSQLLPETFSYNRILDGQIIDILSKLSHLDKISMEFGDNYLYIIGFIEDTNMKILCKGRVIEGAHPIEDIINFTEKTKINSKYSIVIEQKELINVVKRLNMFKMADSIILRKEGNTIKISATNSGTVSYDEYVPYISTTLEDKDTIKIPTEFLLRLITTTKKEDNLLFLFNKNGSVFSNTVIECMNKTFLLPLPQ